MEINPEALSAMETLKPLARRFAGPVIAVYFLYLGIWVLTEMATQIVMAFITPALHWVQVQLDWALSGASISMRWFTHEIPYGIVPIILGLLIGGYSLRQKREIQKASS